MRHDLDVPSLAPSTSRPETKAAIQGLRQCVLSKDSEHIHVTQVVGLEHVPMLDVGRISFPLVQEHTLWYRNDVEIEVVQGNQKTKMLRVVRVSSSAL